jgi:hypothetical protein
MSLDSFGSTSPEYWVMYPERSHVRREIAVLATGFDDAKASITNLERTRVWRMVVGVAVLAGLAVSIASCGGNGSQAPTETPTTTTTTTTTTAPAAPPATPAPTEKSINPTAGNLFTPPVKAPAAPTAIPGNRENTG